MPGWDHPAVAADLLEREAALDVLESAVADAAAGTGSVVLLFGQAGIGKTSVVRALRRRVEGRVRVLVGVCDDLLAPRTLGPLHDVAATTREGPLAAALRRGRDEVLSAVEEELADRLRPTVLVIEDAHWADEATVDVLRYVGRRIEDLPAVLLVTYRDDELAPHLLRRVLGGLSGTSVRRVPLRPLSRTAVARWAGGTNITTSALYQLTGGNPFFVSEVLAGLGDSVPLTVVDAVLARVRRLDDATRRALEQLAVVPSQVELPLARALLGELSVLGQAERLGVLEVRSTAVAFRHELARRAVEASMPVSERIRLNERVLTRLLDGTDPDLARGGPGPKDGVPGGLLGGPAPAGGGVGPPAVRAGDDARGGARAPGGAGGGGGAGAHRRAARLYELVLHRADLLTTAEHAAIAEA